MKVRSGAAPAPAPSSNPKAPAASKETTEAKAAVTPTVADQLTDAESPALVALDGTEASASAIFQYHSPPMSESQEGNGVVVNWDGTKATRNDVDTSHNRVGASASTTSGQLSSSFSVSQGQTELSTTFTGTQANAPTASASIGSWSGALAFGLGSSVTSTDQSSTASFNAYATLDRSLSLLGRYEGDEPSLTDTHQVELKRSYGGMGIVNLTKVASFLGLAGGLIPSANRDLVYRTHLNPEATAKVALEPNGIVGFLRDKARAAGLLKETLAVPSLDEPETLKLGDELQVHTTGAVSLGIAAGAFGVSVGAQLTLQGEFDLAAKKTGEHLIELTVTPTDVKGIQASLGLPLIGDLSAQLQKASALKQSFTFDLSQPAGKAAYLAALKGTLPGAVALADGAALAKAVRDETLPAGVTRHFAEATTATRTTRGAGLNFSFIQEGGFIGGLGAYWSKASATHHRTDGTTLATVDTRDVHRKSEVLLSGTESVSVRAARRSVTTFDEKGAGTTRFDGVRLQVMFSDDKVRGLELNGDVVEKVNQLFGLTAPKMERKRQNQQWEVSVSRELSDVELGRLATASPSQLQQAATHAGVSLENLQTLSRNLRTTSDAGVRADQLLTFIAAEGLPGFAAVQSLLGNPGELQVERSTDAYSRALEQVEKLGLKYPKPFAARDGAKVLEQRFTAAAKAMESLQRAIDDLSDDPFTTPDETKTVRAQLQQAEQRIEQSYDVKHLSRSERQALYAELDRGWTTFVELAVQDHLSAAGV